MAKLKDFSAMGKGHPRASIGFKPKDKALIALGSQLADMSQCSYIVYLVRQDLDRRGIDLRKDKPMLSQPVVSSVPSQPVQPKPKPKIKFSPEEWAELERLNEAVQNG